MNFTPEQIDRIVKARRSEVYAAAARRVDVHTDAAPDFAPAIAEKFEYDPATDVLQRREGVPATVTIDSIIDAARVTHPHRFRDIPSAPPSQNHLGSFGGFAAGVVSGDDFFRLSPEEKIAAGNEMKRPRA